MHTRLGAPLIAVLLAFAPGSPTTRPADAQALPAPIEAAVVVAVDGCDIIPCDTVSIVLAGGNLPVYDIVVAKAGTGKGRITSEPPYLNCGESCETSLESGAELTLIADPDPGSKFSKWTGACAGQGATCKITLTSDMTATATFKAVVVATAEPTEEPTAEPIATLVATVSPTVTIAPPTIAPTVEPTPASTPDPGPSDAGGSGPAVIVLALLLAGLLGALGFVVIRGRRKGLS